MISGNLRFNVIVKKLRRQNDFKYLLMYSRINTRITIYLEKTKCHMTNPNPPLDTPTAESTDLSTHTLVCDNIQYIQPYVSS